MYRRSASVPSCAAQIWPISFSFASSASIGSISMMLSVILFAIDCCIYRTIELAKTYKQNVKNRQAFPMLTSALTASRPSTALVSRPLSLTVCITCSRVPWGPHPKKARDLSRPHHPLYSAAYSVSVYITFPTHNVMKNRNG